MEPEGIRKDMLSMIDALSNFINENNIELTEMKDLFVYNLICYVQKNSLKGLKKVIDLFHRVMGHQGSSFRLECKNLHCIECYAYFVNHEFYNEDTACTCGNRINPKWRSNIQSEYNRLQTLKKQCQLCLVIKDIMNFNQIDHGCSLCIDCLKSNFKFFADDNNCPCCLYLYSEASLNAIRSVLSDQQDPANLIKFYSKECYMCGKNKDSRLFTQICKNEHFSCEECIKELVNTNRNSCGCGLEISVILKN